MNEFGLAFHHVGLAVREPSAARKLVEGLGYRLQAPVFDSEQNVNLIMALHDVMPDIEIIWSSGSAGPLDKMLQEHARGIVYHLCYVTDDLAASLTGMKAAGLAPFCVSAPKQAVLFGGRLVSFYLIKGVGLIEVIEGTPRDPVEDARLWTELEG